MCCVLGPGSARARTPRPRWLSRRRLHAYGDGSPHGCAASAPRRLLPSPWGHAGVHRCHVVMLLRLRDMHDAHRRPGHHLVLRHHLHTRALLRGARVARRSPRHLHPYPGSALAMAASRCTSHGARGHACIHK